MKDFKLFVIDVAVKQINEFSDLNVSYDQKKKGRNINSLIFTIRQKEKVVTQKAKKLPKTHMNLAGRDYAGGNPSSAIEIF